MSPSITFEMIRAALGERPRDSHKGSNGRGLLLAGSPGFTGAALMAAAAALRGGIGTLKVLCPESVRPAFFALPEAMVFCFAGDWDACPANTLDKLLSEADCIALGPGIGKSEGVLCAARAALTTHKPMVLDADGLNMLSTIPDKAALLHENVILTPHPGEMARLTGLAPADILADIERCAIEYAKRWGCVVLLKSAQSAVASPEGLCLRNTTGNPGLAKGGSGDVLTGITLAMLGQRLSPMDAACAGAYLLGASADAAVSLLAERMLMARDVVGMVETTVKDFARDV